MFRVYDPCAACPKGKELRKRCQGTPFVPGPCPSAKEHWEYVSDHECGAYASDSYHKQQHIAARNPNRHRGWGYE